jgi:DNA-binding LacI/PurR family transcriptional regulator
MDQVTLHDVAVASGVSAQTVSRVVNQRPDVAVATRTRVWEAIRKLGYKPNTLARGLVSQRSHVLGIITLILDDFFRAQVVTGFEKEARAQGYACHLSFTQGETEDLPELIDDMLARQVDGIALLAPKRFAYPELHVDVPVVAVAHMLDNPRAINVDVDNVDGAYQAISYLLAQGHRSIGQITGPADWIPVIHRNEGARRALAEYQLTMTPRDSVECPDWTLQSGYDAARQLLENCPEITAIFCHNDWMALGAYRALREASRRIPEDVSVLGYDDLPVCQFMDPPLASVRQPSQGLGQLMAQLVITAIQHAEPYRQDVLVPAELMVRGSVMAPCLVA